MKILPGHDIKRVEEFKYLGIGSIQHDVSVRIWSSWAALNSLNTILKYNLSRKLKIYFFRATVGTVFVYCSIKWTLISDLEKNKLIESIHACCELY